MVVSARDGGRGVFLDEGIGWSASVRRRVLPHSSFVEEEELWSRRWGLGVRAGIGRAEGKGW